MGNPSSRAPTSPFLKRVRATRRQQWLQGVAERYKQFRSTRQLAYEYGCSQNTIEWWLREAGVKLSPRRCGAGSTGPRSTPAPPGSDHSSTLCDLVARLLSIPFFSKVSEDQWYPFDTGFLSGVGANMTFGVAVAHAYPWIQFIDYANGYVNEQWNIDA